VAKISEKKISMTSDSQMAGSDLTPTSSAPSLTRRHMIMGGALLATSGLALARQPREVVPPLAPKKLEQLVPEVIGGWTFQSKSGLVLPAEDPLSDNLYSHIVTRVYQSPTQLPIMMLIAYSNKQNGMLQLHRPEICYPAGGFRLSETELDQLEIAAGKSLPIRHFSAESGSRNEQVLYWTRIGKEHPTSWFDQRMAVVRSNLRAEIPDGILVRVSTIAPNYQEARASLEGFARALVASGTPQLRALLVGQL
jgi:EpsI family protein